MINYGHGVTLAPVLENQLGKMIVWRNDRRVWKWCRQNSVISEAHHRAWFASLAGNPKIRMFSVIADNGDFVGVCGLTDIDMTNRRAEFSLYIGPEHQGKGLGKAALKTLLDHGFEDLNLNLIWGETFDENPAYKMFESLGFILEGIRQDFYFSEGKYIAAKLYSMKKDEKPWKSSHLL